MIVLSILVAILWVNVGMHNVMNIMNFDRGIYYWNDMNIGYRIVAVLLAPITTIVFERGIFGKVHGMKIKDVE